MNELPYRQIHLDFHTSPYIGDIGEAFDAEAFVKTLKAASVNSVNVFAKCHHGMSYYPTKLGKVHPALKRDLLGEMLSALNREGLGAIVYFPAGWEETAAENANWLEVSRDGILGGKPPFETGHYRWRKLCLGNEEYIDFVLKQTRELLDGYTFDGFWYDIIFQEGCLCSSCQTSMKQLGMNPQSDEDVKKHDFLMLKKFQEKVLGYVHACNPELLVFFNGHWAPDNGLDEDYAISKRSLVQTHIEIESLPSEQWGYNHFPLFVNYHNRHNSEVIGMNGKFHTAWGDFGSLRNREALEFECFRMIANGAKCSIGDQMHPRGYLDTTVYNRIGQVYSQIEEREPWCTQSTKVSQIGVIMANRPLHKDFAADEGVMRMLLELHHSFDFIDASDDWNKYELVIMPDEVRCDARLAAKVSDYIKRGGRLLASYHSGLAESRDEWAVPELGVKFVQEGSYTPSYLIIREDSLSGRIEPYEYALYEPTVYVEPLPGSNVLAWLGKPYFNRSYDRFCSHQHTPYDQTVPHPGIVQNGNVIYMAHAVFTDYIKLGTRVHREMVRDCIERLLSRPLVMTDLPPSAEITVRRQGSRLIVHLLHYIAERKSRKQDIVDTKLPLYNFIVKVKHNEEPSNIYLAPANEPLEYEWENGYVSVKVPKLDGHSMIVIES